MPSWSEKSVFFLKLFDHSATPLYSVQPMNTQPQKVTPSDSERERQLTLELLQAIDQKDDISQRHLAQEMGVALGLANSYLKRCVKKGWIKITTAPANRYLYYLTPKGFAEKTKLTTEFFTTSLALFRQAGSEYSQLIEKLSIQGKQQILFVGLSDLTEIALMRALQSKVQVVSIYQPDAGKDEFFGLTVADTLPSSELIDAVILTSMEQTNELLEELESVFTESDIHLPPMLLKMKYRTTELEYVDQ